MRKLIEFIRSVYVPVLFVVLEIFALSQYATSNPYAQARLLTRSNQVVGGVQGFFTRVRNFWSLGVENRRLTARVVELEEELMRYRAAEAEGELKLLSDTMRSHPYFFTTARVAGSSINRTNNFVVLNRGERDGVTPDMAVLSESGAMVGYVVSTSENYSVALTVLSPHFKASGHLADYPDIYESIHWRGDNKRYVWMENLSKYAEGIEVGDEVLSTGFSGYFPPDVPIGTVESFRLNETGDFYTVKIRLKADIGALQEVILLRPSGQEEVKGLEAKLKKRYH